MRKRYLTDKYSYYVDTNYPRPPSIPMILQRSPLGGSFGRRFLKSEGCVRVATINGLRTLTKNPHLCSYIEAYVRTTVQRAESADGVLPLGTLGAESRFPILQLLRAQSLTCMVLGQVLIKLQLSVQIHTSLVALIPQLW